MSQDSIESWDVFVCAVPIVHAHPTLTHLVSANALEREPVTKPCDEPQAP